MFLQHGNVGVGYSYLIFLAYKAISQKTSSFFHQLCKKNHNEFYKLTENTVGVLPQSTNNVASNMNASNSTQTGVSNTATKEEHISVEKNESTSLLSNGKLKSSDPPVGVEEFDGYDIFFNMVTDLKHASIQDIFERIIMSTFLLNCLEATNYFENDTVNVKDETNDTKGKDFELQKRIMFAGLIFQAYSVILSNNHTVGEVDSLNIENELELSSFVGIKRNLIGNCVFARVASILNHSCDPNTSPVYINGKTQVLRTLFSS